MPCDGSWNAEEAPVKRKALTGLEAALERGEVAIKKDRVTGKVLFDGWKDRGDWHDECAHRALLAEGSSALRMALARQTSTAQRGMQASGR